MTITPDQARELLANQSERGALWNADWNFTDRTAAIVREDSPGDEVMEIPFKGDDTAFSDGDLDLAAAAPDLAQTVIEQGKRIEELETQHAEWEYGVEHLGHVSRWGSRESAEDDLGYHLRTSVFIPRLVRRLVGPVEVTE